MTFVKQHPAQVNSMLHELLNAFPSSWGRDLPVNHSLPPVNIHETNEGFHLELNAPGRNKEDFKVKLEKDLLTISYEQKENATDSIYKTIRREFQYKGFKRSFSLDDQIQVDGIQAKYENGILKLFLPRIEKVVNNPKEITIL
jgi:HSP20 family protein